MSDSSEQNSQTVGPGDRCGPWLLEQEVGAGASATVYRARNDAGEVAAIKVLQPSAVMPEEVKRFTREFRTLSRLDHPNIVKVFGSGMTGRFPWIAMEHVEGEDLDGVLARWSKESPPDRFEQVDSLFRDLADALTYLHSKGLIHRDIKPSNILMGPDGSPRIGDFGVVKDPEATGTQLTVAGRLVGTVAFMAPEVISGEAVDTRADLYALGAVLYLLLTGRRPIEARSVAAYLARHLTEVPAAPSEIDPSVPHGLEFVCKRLLAKEPGHRFASAAEAVAALDNTSEIGLLPIRGRDEVMAAWGRRLHSLEAGSGGVMTIRGMSGLGRSHLLSNMALAARGFDVRIVQLSDVADPDAHLAEALGLDEVNRSAIAPSLSGRPLVLVCDDFEPHGSASDLCNWVLGRVAREGLPWLLLLADSARDGRDEWVPPGVPHDVVELKGLERPAVIAILRDRDLAGAAAPVLGRRLHEEYLGNPAGVVAQFDALVDAGWLARKGDVIKAAVPLDRLKRGPLPVPEAVRTAWLNQFESLHSAHRRFCEALAVLGRPAAVSLLMKVATVDDGSEWVVDALVERGMLAREAVEGGELVRFVHPSAARIVVESMRSDAKKDLHRQVARVLGSRRRRDSVVEVAHHLGMAGERAAAYPLWIRAARRAARAGQYVQVERFCERAESFRMEAEPGLDAADAVVQRRWLRLLHGEANLAMGNWDAAIGHLIAAVDAAREEGDPSWLARCLGSLGRALYRKGRFKAAEAPLVESLSYAEPGAPGRAAANRALADIHLRTGRFASARDLWRQTVELAMAEGSKDAEARARRGLAHATALLGDLPGAAFLLEEADDLLGLMGDARVQSGVLARLIELDIAAGRLGNAARRSQQLLELCERQELSERMGEAHMLRGDALMFLGVPDVAKRHFKEAERFAAAFEAHRQDTMLRCARSYAEMGCWQDMARVLPDVEDMTESLIYDGRGQCAALSAWLVARDAPSVAREQATWALLRSPAKLSLSRAALVRDACMALHFSGASDHAIQAIRAGLDGLPAEGTLGLYVELSLARYEIGREPEVKEELEGLTKQIEERLSPDQRKSFAARIQACLGSGAKTP